MAEACQRDCAEDNFKCLLECGTDTVCTADCNRGYVVCEESCPCYRECYNGCPCESENGAKAGI